MKVGLRSQVKNGTLNRWLFATDRYYHATWYALPREGLLLFGDFGNDSGYIIIASREIYLRQVLLGHIHSLSAVGFTPVLAPNGDHTHEWVCPHNVMVSSIQPVERIRSLEDVMVHGTQVLFCKDDATVERLEDLLFGTSNNIRHTITRLICDKKLLSENVRQNINSSPLIARLNHQGPLYSGM